MAGVNRLLRCREQSVQELGIRGKFAVGQSDIAADKTKAACPILGEAAEVNVRGPVYLQESLTIFKLVTLRSPYSLPEASFFSLDSIFTSMAFDSLAPVPVTVTVWPRWAASFTFLL